jgi:hypothetical protein
VKGLNSKFYEAYNKPFISHAFHSADGTAMAVNLVTLFGVNEGVAVNI